MYGVLDDDYNSCDTIQTTLEQNMPEALILGDVSHGHISYYKNGDLAYLNVPDISTGVRPEHTLARKRMNKFFQEEID